MHPRAGLVTRAKRREQRVSYLVAVQEGFQRFHKPLMHDILVIRTCVAVVVQNVGHILVHIRNEVPQLGSDELVEQLLHASLRPKVRHGREASASCYARAKST